MHGIHFSFSSRLEPEWIQLSCSEVCLGIIFIAVGFYITNHINNLKTDSTYKRNIRLSLWGYCVIYVFLYTN